MKSYFKQTNRQNWNRIFEGLKENIRKFDGDCEVEIKKAKKKPTDSQRGFYYAVILPAINEYQKSEGNYYSDLGKLHDDIKGAIQDEFGLYDEVENKLTGEIEKRPISLSDSRGDYENVRKFIEAVLIFSAKEFGLNIPDPYLKGY